MMLSIDPGTARAETLRMVRNPELIAISQDPGGAQGARVAEQGPVSVWVKPLADGQQAVMVLNASPGRRATASVAGATIGLPGARRIAVRDVWAHRTDVQTGRLTATVPADGAVLLRVERG